MITLETKLKDLYKDSELEKFTKYLYYGFDGDYWLNNPIGHHCEGLWRNDETVKSLNDLEVLYKNGVVDLVYLDKNKPDVNIILLKQNKPSKFAILLAGGCFTSVATAVETLPIGTYLFSKGFTVGILTYSIRENAKLNGSVEDMAKAVNYVNEHKNELKVSMDDYIAIGCSAGGNVVSRFARKDIGYASYNAPKPLLIGLAYPVITFGKYSHTISKETVLGKNPSEEIIKLYSTELHVDKDYPSTYMWQCKNDEQVPIQNSEFLSRALEKANVKRIYRVFDSDAHGWGIGTGTLADGWLDDLLSYYESLL